MTTLVFGHKSPDTDATGSPIVWAWYLNEVKGHTAEAVLLGEPNTETAWVLERWETDRPRIIEDVEEGQSVVVVDTNNPDELPPSIDKAEIHAIIDHHRLAGGLKTAGPADITVRPLACTATIMHDLMGEDADRMPDAIKGIMMSCILSDTLEFSSPTTTEHDQKVAEKLASDLGINVSSYAAEMFAAKSDVSGFSDKELIRMDSKLFETNGTRLRVSVVETTSPDQILERKESLKEALVEVAKEEEVDQVLLFVVDILEGDATLILQNDRVREIAENSFATVCGDDDQVRLPGVVSRKKQILPNLKA